MFKMSISVTNNSNIESKIITHIILIKSVILPYHLEFNFSMRSEKWLNGIDFSLLLNCCADYEDSRIGYIIY